MRCSCRYPRINESLAQLYVALVRSALEAFYTAMGELLAIYINVMSWKTLVEAIRISRTPGTRCEHNNQQNNDVGRGPILVVSHEPSYG